MTALTKKTSPKRRLLLASDRSDQSSELASILQSVGEVDTIATSEIPDAPARDLSGIVVDINLRSPESVQLVRNKLRAEAYREMPRLFVLADALHHGSMQAWALGATDTICAAVRAQGILQRIRAAFPDDSAYDETDRGKTLNRGVEAAHAVMVKIFEKLPAGVPLKFSDIVEAETKILKAIKHSSLREWLTTVGCHHRQLSALPVRHRLCGRVRPASRHARGRPAPAHPRRAAARCRQGVRSGRDPRQARRADTDEEMDEIASIRAAAIEALAAQGGFPPEMLDVVLHHHEFLDGTGYPDGLSRQADQRHRAADDDRRYLCRAGREARLSHALHPRQGVRDDGRDGRQARSASAAGVPPGGVGIAEAVATPH